MTARNRFQAVMTARNRSQQRSRLGTGHERSRSPESGTRGTAMVEQQSGLETFADLLKTLDGCPPDQLAAGGQHKTPPSSLQ